MTHWLRIHVHTCVYRTAQNTLFTHMPLKRHFFFYYLLFSASFMAGLHGQDGFLNSVKTLASIDACTSKHSDMVIQPNLQSGLLFLHPSGHSRHTHRNTPNGLMVMPIYTFISAISSSVKNKCSFPRPVSEQI